nr:hypothetical protein [Tanacetum cinerariifolium]
MAQKDTELRVCFQSRDIVQLEIAVYTVSHEYLLEFTSEHGIPETLHPVLHGPEDRIVDFPEGKIEVYTRVFPTVVDWRTNAPKDGMPAAGTYSLEAVRGVAAPEIPSSEDVPATVASGVGQAEEAATMDPPTASESRKKGHDGADVNASPKSLRRDYADPQPSGSSRGGKSLAAIQLGMASSVVLEDAPVGVSDPDPVSFADAPSRHPADVAQSSQGIAAVGDPGSENVSSPAEACQDLVDHAAPPGYFSELRHMHNEEFLGQYNINLARQVAMGSQLRLRFEQEAKLLRKSVAQMARRDQRIQARELEIKNLEARLETEAGMKKAAEDKSAVLIKELEDLRARFSDLQVATLQEQVSGEEKLKAAFEEFKRYEDERVEQRCAELDARLDALSIDFD